MNTRLKKLAEGYAFKYANDNYRHAMQVSNHGHTAEESYIAGYKQAVKDAAEIPWKECFCHELSQLDTCEFCKLKGEK